VVICVSRNERATSKSTQRRFGKRLKKFFKKLKKGVDKRRKL